MLLKLFFITMCCLKITGIKVTGHDTSVRYGETATLFSQLTETKDSLSRIIWWKKTREDPVDKYFLIIYPDGSTEHVNGLKDRIKFIGNITEKTGSVKLLGTRLLDEGIYTCIFNLFPSGPFEININVTVLVPPDVNVMGETPVSRDVDVTLASCFASNARPAAEVLWRLGPLQTSLRSETSNIIHPNGTFTVVSKLIGDPLINLNQQKIQCVVKHEALDEEIVMDYLLNIHYPPQSVMIIPVSPTEAKEFQCIVDCNPSATNYTWRRENKTIQSKGNNLFFPELSSASNGLYICEASNQYGSFKGSLYVTVYTESSRVCWSLFGVIICFAVLSLGAYTLWRYWKSKQSPKNEQQGTPAESQELRRRRGLPSDIKTADETAALEVQETI